MHASQDSHPALPREAYMELCLRMHLPRSVIRDWQLFCKGNDSLFRKFLSPCCERSALACSKRHAYARVHYSTDGRRLTTLLLYTWLSTCPEEAVMDVVDYTAAV